MNDKAVFSLRGRNPDVLTSIANLSNDEVFTPPSLANQMLDSLEAAWALSNGGKSIWQDSSVTFLDPFTKSGVFLREITKRLVDGLEGEFPDLQSRVNHILSKQVFGIAVTKLTSLLSRRSLYCAKHANGEHSISTVFSDPQGNVYFEPMDHTWVGGRERVLSTDQAGNEISSMADGKCKFCGANQKDYQREDSESYAYPFIHCESTNQLTAKKFGVDVKFDVVIGNPPYQLGQSGGESIGGFAMPIYQKFVEAAQRLEPRFVVMVTPSRWFAGGRGLDEFRATMLSDKRIRSLVDFPDASDAFPGTQIKGGVSFFLWDKSWSGNCDFSTCADGRIISTVSRSLSAYDVLVRRNEAIPVLEKVLKSIKQNKFEIVSSNVSAIQPFSLRTTFKGKPEITGLTNPVLVYGNGGTSWTSMSEIPRNHEWISEWKVLLGAAYGAGDSFPHQIYNFPIVAGPGSACTETYLVISRFNSELEAANFAEYLKTKFVRFLVSLRKYTQHLYSDRFSFVPQLDFSQRWTDERLFEFFEISADEQQMIDSIVRPMESINE